MKIVFSAVSSGSGKTTFVLGILRALCARGWRIRPYKIGPDYIDTEYHRQICQCSAINLDGFLLSGDQMQSIFLEYHDQDISVIEGVMGLHDGLGSTRQFSTASVAKQIGAPVVLIMDARGMAATAAAIVNGMQDDQSVTIQGVLFNRIRSSSHYQILKEAVERDAGIPCLGYLPEDAELTIPSRHLGITPHQEMAGIEYTLNRLQHYSEKYIELDRLVEIAKCGLSYPASPLTIPYTIPVTIAVAYDPAFSFYYADNLRLMEKFGANLVFFSPLGDAALPKCDGIYIGGGFPELFAKPLEENRTMRNQIYAFAQSGKPIFAECGGYMYLMDKMVTHNQAEYAMCGVFRGKACMQNKLNAQFGYVETELLHDTSIGKKGKKFRSHEFHHSAMISNELPQYESTKISTGRQWQGGHLVKNCFGTYSHIYFRSDLSLLYQFLSSCMS